MKRILFAILLAFAISPIQAQSDHFRRSHFNLDDELALDGYDPVSYFTGKPSEGDEDISYVHQGVVYHFSSPSNMAKFKSNPALYEPQYGGWCAYAMGETGEKVKVDPETYKIVDGKLYLFYNFWGNNTLEDWNKTETKLRAAADLNWRKISQ